MPTTSGLTIGGALRSTSRSSWVILKPAAVIVSSVGRLQLQPWPSRVWSRFSRSCHLARRRSSARTCSMNSRPPRISGPRRSWRWRLRVDRRVGFVRFLDRCERAAQKPAEQSLAAEVVDGPGERAFESVAVVAYDGRGDDAAAAVSWRGLELPAGAWLEDVGFDHGGGDLRRLGPLVAASFPEDAEDHRAFGHLRPAVAALVYFEALGLDVRPDLRAARREVSAGGENLLRRGRAFRADRDLE